MKHRLFPLALCLLAAALFGASAPASKAFLATLPPLALAGFLYLGAACATLPFAVRGRAQVQWNRKNVYRLGGAILFGGVLGPVLMLIGLHRAPAASTALWLGLETPATAILAVWLFREHLHARGWLAVGLVTAASVILAAPQDFSLAPAAGLIALACVAWGLDNSFTSLIDGFTPAQSTFVKGAVAGAINLTLALALDPSWTLGMHAVWAMAVGCLAYGASIVLYVSAAQHLGAVRSQMAFATAPFFGVALAWTLGGEPMTLAQLVAASLMVVSIFLGATERHAHAHAHAAVRHTHWHRHDDGHHDHAHAAGYTRAILGWHIHEHAHEALSHSHAHGSDLHHRHEHDRRA